MTRPAFSAEADAVLIERLALLADGPRVHVLEARCTACGEDVLTEDYPEAGPLGHFTVAAAVLRELAAQWHTDDCPGPIQWATEPVPADLQEPKEADRG